MSSLSSPQNSRLIEPIQKLSPRHPTLNLLYQIFLAPVFHPVLPNSTDDIIIHLVPEPATGEWCPVFELQPHHFLAMTLGKLPKVFKPQVSSSEK